MQTVVGKGGLDGVVVAQTRLSSIDGEAGEFVIAGIPIEQLAPQAAFEETVYLLWNGELPTSAELASFRSRLASLRSIPQSTQAVLEGAARSRLSPLDALRLAIDSLEIPTGSTNETEAELLLASVPVLVASYWRLQNGGTVIGPRADESLVESFLYMLTGERATTAHIRALSTYLNTMVDHGMNASTFTARVIVSTRSDLKSAVVGALGALKGPLHGGAPEPALDMLLTIGTAEKAEPHLRAALEKGERLMGFGHRVYKVRDPRAEVLSQAADALNEESSAAGLHTLARSVESVAVRLLDEYKPGRQLRANAEFYTAVLLNALELPRELFTATFAVARVAGWLAHGLEQQTVDRLFRPQSEYCGPDRRDWLPVEAR